jgi:hypothetical protein
MSFFCAIRVAHPHGVEVARVDVLLTFVTAAGEVDQPFRLDTGAYITTVSEDVAARCGLPQGGPPIPVSGVGGQVTGRLVDVRCRFPPDALSGSDGLEADFQWVVIPGQTKTALLSLADVHRHFSIGTDDAYMHFAER